MIYYITGKITPLRLGESRPIDPEFSICSVVQINASANFLSDIRASTILKKKIQ